MSKKLRLGFLLGILILIFDVAIPLLLAQRVTELRAAAAAASAVDNHLQMLLSAYKDAETGQRGFMLTGREDFLEPYAQGRATVTALLPKLAVDLGNNPAQMRRFQQLLDLDKEEAAYQQEQIAQRRKTGEIAHAAAEQGKRIMDDLRKLIGAISNEEQKHIDTLLRRISRLENWSHASLIAVSTIDLILFIVVFWIAQRATTAQLSVGVALTALNRNLSQEITLRSEALQQIELQAHRLSQIVQTQVILAAAQLDLAPFMQLVVNRMLEVMPAAGAVIELIEGDDMVYAAASGSVTKFIGLRLKRKDSLSGLCVAKADVLIADDTSTDSRVDRAACEKIGVVSMIVAPLMQAGKPVGVFKVVAGERNAFDTGAVQTLQLMAGFLGAAFGNQLQFEKNQALLTERGVTLSALKRELRRREEYEEKLVRQRERTETILESSHEAFICIDSQGRVREWNALAATTFGWSKEEAQEQLLGDLIIPERFRAAHRHGIAHFLLTGEEAVLNRRIELQALCRDGREIPVEMTISAIRDGEQIEFPCFLRDITARKQVEAAQLNQQATLHALTNAIPALISFIDSNQIYRYCNQQYETVFDIDVNEIVGKSIHQFFGEALYNESKANIDKALAGEAVIYERTIQTAIGVRHQECRHIPQLSVNGQPDGFYLIAWDITERKTQEIEWQSRASIDQLTGLSNRAVFLDALNQAIPLHQRADSALAVLYLDIDRFKHVNDTYGHAAGDVLLKAFAEFLTASLRQTDIVGRFGGDEFCIVMDNIKTPENALAIAEKILTTVRTPVAFEDCTLTISTSIGIAFARQPQMSGTQLIALADNALYRAKQAGRNRYALDIVAAGSAVSAYL
jgi:diguanylate cyclase (GGDEF)-like protein/PAS domain S-box-containing protein